MTSLLHAVRDHALALRGNMHDYDALLEQVGDRSLVLLGESTHGTHEFYRMRAEITRRLILEKQFDAVIVEADWPDALRLNRYVHGRGDEDIDRAFDDFQRFPRWMWRNQDVRDFIHWLASHNDRASLNAEVGFYGLDLYSLYRSADAVMEYLARVDPEQLDAAREVYTCLDHVRDPQRYGYEAVRGLRPACSEALTHQLLSLQEVAARHVREGDLPGRDEHFFAEQNAHVVRGAEHYYRSMFSSRQSSWNVRDQHMADTVLRLQQHRRANDGTGKLVIWAHNSHVGDARATDMARAGEWNLGQLLRQRAAGEVMLVGFTTCTGHVAAAHDWGGEVEHFALRTPLPDSWEALFHQSRLESFYLPLEAPASPLDDAQRQMRAVGVIYRPASERASHYLSSRLGAQFDAIFHLDETSALVPFDRPPHWPPFNTRAGSRGLRT